MKKIDALADIAPEKVIEMFELRLPAMHPPERATAILYLRNYAIVFYSPEEVPAHITGSINELEAKSWPVAQ